MEWLQSERVNCECQTQISAKVAFERENLLFAPIFRCHLDLCWCGVERKLFQLVVMPRVRTRRKLTSFQNQLQRKISPAACFIRYSLFVHFTLTLSMGWWGPETGVRRQMFSVHLSVTLVSTGADKAGTCLVIDSTSLFVIDTIAVFFVIPASCMPDVSTCSLNRARRAHENDSSSGFVFLPGRCS